MGAIVTNLVVDWELVINILSVLVTLFIGVAVLVSTNKYNKNQSDIANHQLQKQLFGEFNKRYDVLNGYLEKITKYESLEHLKKNKPNKYPFLRNKLNDYFNLCAEEFYWYNKGRIDEDLWKSWEVGMNSWYNNHEIIREAWKEEYENFGHQSFYLKEGEQFFKEYKARV
ncbi:hypothetical protein GCM10022291_01240 [Postechiella marina]|uniref:Phage protein n=1 Tax=Postechiella marina TaxID=943941 RepID=A0ABP8BYS0_9FLAO